MREPCCSVGYTGTPGDGGRIKSSAVYTFTWLPKGYAVTMDDRLVCMLFDPEDNLKSSVRSEGRHPLVEAIATAIENHLKKNPADVVGFFENR